MHTHIRKWLWIATSVFLCLAASPVHAHCTKDTECKGDRICERGTCVSPSLAPTKPSEAPSPLSQTPAAEERVAAALQDQLKCDGPPEPGKALRALKSLGFIGPKPKEVVDGMTIWTFAKPVSVFGYKAVQVTGWEDKPDGVFFWRGPGTAPGLHLTVVVEGDAKAVEASVRRAAGTRISVEREAPLPGGKTVAAITCYSK